jgi:beta-glucanase (GH16 family)
LLTKGKLFKYGKVEIRAKLPLLVAEQPAALWMLGDNISNVGWPACGEIDIMEYAEIELIKLLRHYIIGTLGGNPVVGNTTITNAEKQSFIYIR